MIDIDTLREKLKKGLHLSIEPYMGLSFDEICELDEDVARQGVWNLREEIKRLRKQLVAYMDFLNWVAEEHNDVWDEYEGKDEL